MNRLSYLIVIAVTIFPQICSSQTCFFAEDEINDVAGTPANIKVGDLNGDSLPDIATANIIGDRVSILFNSGSGSFEPSVSYSVGEFPISLAIGDLDGDLDNDIVVTTFITREVQLLINLGNGFFSLDSSVFEVPNITGFSQIADLDDDDNPDIIVANENLISIFWNNGLASFTNRSDFSIEGAANSVMLGDLDGDHDLELVTSNYATDSVSILYNLGNRQFGERSDYPVGDCPSALTLGDFNGDSTLDIAVSNRESDTITIRFNSGSGSFDGSLDFACPEFPKYIESLDSDGDSDLDLIVSVGSTGDNTVVSTFLNDGSGMFSIGPFYGTHNAPDNMAVGDFNGDMMADVAVACRLNNPQVSVLLNGNIQLGDLNADGSVDLLDIPIFVDQLIDESFSCQADVNGDGTVNLLDVDPFVDLLT